MNWIQVKSSNIDAYNYNPTTQVFTVRFLPDKKGHQTIGKYAGVPASAVQGFVDAPSKGSYLHTDIKPNYTYTRIQ